MLGRDRLRLTFVTQRLCLAGLAADTDRAFDVLCADRAAIERVAYNHRLGDKPPFEKTPPPTRLEQLVKQDRHQEAVLKKVHGIAAVPVMPEAEVQRMNTTTRAPEMPAEIKAAPGNTRARSGISNSKAVVQGKGRMTIVMTTNNKPGIRLRRLSTKSPRPDFCLTSH